MDTAQNLIRRGWHQFMSDGLFRNSAFLMANTAVLSMTGFIFWNVSAQTFSAEQVGIVTTLVTAASVIAAVSFFGFDYALIRFLPKSPSTLEAKVNTALTLSGLGAIVAGGAYLLFASLFTPSLSFMRASLPWVGIFILGMVVTAWNVLSGSIFTALRSAHFVLLSSLLFGLLRTPFLFLFSSHGTLGLFGAHILALSLGVSLSFILLYRLNGYIFRPMVSRKDIHVMKKYSFGTYITNLSANLPPLFVPIIILHILGPEEVAYYYIPLLIIGLLNIIPIATSQSLLAEGAWSESAIITQVRKASKIIALLLLPCLIVIAAAGFQILQTFGESYAEKGYVLLILLGLASAIKSVSYVLATTLRIHDKVASTFAISLSYAIMVIVGCWTALTLTHDLRALGLSMIACELTMALLYVYTVFKRYKLLNPQPTSNSGGEQYA